MHTRGDVGVVEHVDSLLYTLMCHFAEVANLADPDPTECVWVVPPCALLRLSHRGPRPPAHLPFRHFTNGVCYLECLLRLENSDQQLHKNKMGKQRFATGWCAHKYITGRTDIRLQHLLLLTCMHYFRAKSSPHRCHGWQCYQNSLFTIKWQYVQADRQGDCNRHAHTSVNMPEK